MVFVVRQGTFVVAAESEFGICVWNRLLNCLSTGSKRDLSFDFRKFKKPLTKLQFLDEFLEILKGIEGIEGIEHPLQFSYGRINSGRRKYYRSLRYTFISLDNSFLVFITVTFIL